MGTIWASIVFPIVAWYGLTTDHTSTQNYKDMAAAHFNVSLLINTQLKNPEKAHAENLKAMQIASKEGIRLVVSLPELDQAMRTGSDSDIEKCQKVIREKYRGKPGLFGYTIGDEPGSNSFDKISKIYHALEEADPDSIPYVNLFPNYAPLWALGTADYASYVDQFSKKVHPKILSYDFYPIVDEKSDGVLTYRTAYYANQEDVREVSLRDEIPSWAFSLSVPHGPYPMPTEGHIRWQIFHNLAYGTKGIQYFTYETANDPNWNFKNAILDSNLKKTTSYYYVQKVNAEVEALGPILQKLVSTDVQMTGELHEKCKPFTQNNEIADISGDSVLIGYFDGPRDSRYLMLVNRSFNKDAKVRIKPAPGIVLSEICKKTGSLQSPMELTRDGYSLEFKPGDGRLFQISAKLSQ